MSKSRSLSYCLLICRCAFGGPVMKGGFVQQLKNAALAVVVGAPAKLYNAARTDVQKTKRILKTSLALTSAIALTLPPVLSGFHGKNPFLLGTIVRIPPPQHHFSPWEFGAC